MTQKSKPGQDANLGVSLGVEEGIDISTIYRDEIQNKLAGQER